jgi:hypothetical protein
MGKANPPLLTYFPNARPVSAINFSRAASLACSKLVLLRGICARCEWRPSPSDQTSDAYVQASSAEPGCCNPIPGAVLRLRLIDHTGERTQK